MRSSGGERPAAVAPPPRAGPCDERAHPVALAPFCLSSETRRASSPRRREEEAARRLVRAAALPVLAVARHRGVRVRDHLAVLEHVAARRHLDLLLRDRRAVVGVAAPFAGGIDPAF